MNLTTAIIFAPFIILASLVLIAVLNLGHTDTRYW